MTNLSTLPLLPALLVLGAAPALADTIYRTDGKVIQDVTIESETLTEVAYKDGRDKKTIASESVLRVEFERMPTLVDEAMGLIQEDDLASALDNLDDYVDEQIEKPTEKRYKWAPAFAAWKACEIRMEVADLDGLEGATKRLIDNFPESRYLPMAFLAKARAEAQKGSGAKAQATLETLSGLIDSKGLSKRWNLECRLAQIQVGDQSGEDKRKELGVIVTEASGKYPTVQSRALVAEGETYLAEADRTNDQAKAKTLRGQAQGVFQKIVDDSRADDETLAGAYSGLGDCYFFLGLDANNDAELLTQAAMNYLRVVTIYKEQSRYVPRSLYYAARCFDFNGDRRRTSDMKRELAGLYPNSSWASKAEKL
jgi:hypothetical protein